ncbi:DUF4835 family protein [uncultured Duncaniella sp.]|uniref:type IX secretion system protein PorD n=1 Tax=uncultured Duncaniella sp. TaxID=2768039 RepID=UPI00263165AE|nr:DUF4835 family protein [uncultured Duncaniella sp.]
MKLILSLIFSILGFSVLQAQELNCRVEVNAAQLEGSNKSIFETLQTAINEYVNTTRWTQAQFSPNEKIECTLLFTISKYDESTGTMEGTLQVQSSRPVYNSSYLTTLINFKDNNIAFTYTEGEPLLYSETSMESQLTQILNFYIYLILAVDFDSFSPRGGDQFFERLETIVHQGQSSGETGWKAFEDTKNRAAVLASFTDPSTRTIRDLYYTYHLQGLDQMSVSPDKGRKTIDGALDILNDVFKVAQMSVGLSMFKDAKLDELVNIYSKAPADEREHAYQLLSPMFPTEQTRLEKIKQGDTQ